MAKYASVSDVRDSVRVEEEDLLFADAYIDSLLLSSFGLDPSSLTQIPQVLKELAILVALERACVRLSQSEESVYLEKAQHYRALKEELLEKLAPRVLGIEQSALTAKLGRA